MNIWISILFTLFFISIYGQKSNNTLVVDTLISTRDSLIQAHTLSDKDKEQLKQQALNSLEDLGKYINVIVDKSLSNETKLSNVNLALDLFYADTALVETTSLNGKTKKKTIIRKYLQNLMYLQYKRVDITWADIYVSDNFKKSEDGRWFGIATFCQRFRAKTLKKGEQNIQFNIEQTTCKNITLIVEARQDGNHKFWDLKFGNIEVNEEK